MVVIECANKKLPQTSATISNGVIRREIIEGSSWDKRKITVTYHNIEEEE